MTLLLERALFAAGSLLYLHWLYQIAIAVRGLRSPAPPPRAGRPCRFAVVVPARDEERVIGHLLDSLNAQSHPRDAFDVFVCCDGCADATPRIAREKGARVLDRDDGGPPGKTANLRWALGRLPLDEYDAVVVFDADNLAHPEFLARMSDALAADPDAAAIQGYLDVKNPEDTWVTRVYALSFWYANRFWQLARDRAGLSVNLGGTGEVLRVAALRRLGWTWTSLTDDLELTCEIVLAGERVRYAPLAIAYDEKPLDLRASRAQRARWLSGHYWALRRYGARLLAMAVRRRDPAPLDLALHLAIPGRAAMSYATMFGGFLIVAGRTLLRPGWLREDPQAVVWLLFPTAALVQCALIGVVAPSLHHGALTLGYVRDLPSFFWYGVRWLPTAALTAVRRDHQDAWARTRHERAVPIGDLTRPR